MKTPDTPTCQTTPPSERRQSDWSICVDLVDWNQADSEFKAMVSKQGMVELQH
ncbi:MAG: hypothetical protein WBK51_14985 [Polaromonas sp.]